MTTCGIWYSGNEYFNFLTNGQVQPLTKSAEISPDSTQQPVPLFFENNNTANSFNTCAFDGTYMYVIAGSNQALYRIQKQQRNFTASLYTTDSGFATSSILPLKNWSSNNNCVYVSNSTGLRPECGNNANTLKAINDTSIDYVNFATAVAAPPNVVYRLDSGSQLSMITINNNMASIVRRNLQPPLNINSIANVTVSLSSDNANFLLYEKSSGLVQIIKSINSSTNIMLNTDKKQISDANVIGATFNNSNLILATTGNQYNLVSTSDFFTTANNNTASFPDAVSASGGRYIDPAVAGGFTVLGLVLGALIATAIIFFIRWMRQRKRQIRIPNEDIYTPGTKEMLVTDTLPVEEVVVHDSLPTNSTEITLLNGPSIEANPIQTSISTLFLSRCNIQNFGPAQHSSNPHIGAGIYSRECTYKGKPGLIHYMASDCKDQFENVVHSLTALCRLRKKYTHMLELYDAFQFSSPTEDSYNIQYVLITSYYETKESLAHLYKRHKEGMTVVNVKDEVFIICTIYSLLQSVRGVHRAGYAHRFLSMYSFYAESYAPTLDWILSDFSEAKQSLDLQKDIYDLGGVIYTVISGGRNFSDDRSRGLINKVIEEVTQNQKYQYQYRKILDASLNRDQRYSADQLVKLWESFFDFKN